MIHALLVAEMTMMEVQARKAIRSTRHHSILEEILRVLDINPQAVVALWGKSVGTALVDLVFKVR